MHLVINYKVYSDIVTALCPRGYAVNNLINSNKWTEIWGDGIKVGNEAWDDSYYSYKLSPNSPGGIIFNDNSACKNHSLLQINKDKIIIIKLYLIHSFIFQKSQFC